jgi:hypothetical protein
LEVLGHEVEWTLGFALAEVPLPSVQSINIDRKNDNMNIKQNFKRIRIFSNICNFLSISFQQFLKIFRNVSVRIYNSINLYKSTKI